MAAQITTNGHRRELLSFWELSQSERADVVHYMGDRVEDDEDDYDDRDTPRFVRAYGSVYDVHDAQRITVTRPGGTGRDMGAVNVTPDSPFATWHGVETESVWSGTVFRLLSGDDAGLGVVGRFYDGGEA
jgi:hypothetical protein